MNHEFQSKWEQVLPQVREAMSRVLRATPVVSDDQFLERERRATELRREVGILSAVFGPYGLALCNYLPEWLRHEDSVDVLVRFLWRAARYASNGDDTLSADAMPDHDMPVVRINAPAWFKNPDFMKWVKDRRTATWHGGEDEPHSSSDVFFTYCNGEGSDWPGDDERPGIPDEIWYHLAFIVAEQHGWGAEVLVWVSNLE